MDKFSILRSVTHPDAGHESASHYLLTGYKPTNDIPAQRDAELRLDRGQGARPAPAGPAGLHRRAATAAQHGGRPTSAWPTIRSPSAATRASTNFSVRNLTLPNGISLDRLENRRKLLQTIDTLRRDSDQTGLMDGLDAFTAQGLRDGHQPGRSEGVRHRRRRTPRLRDRYGRTNARPELLLARRLVEAGVTFVTVNAGGWDTHANNFEALKKQEAAASSIRAWAALVQDLHARGLIEEHAGAGLGRVRPDAAHQQGRRPRPLAGRHVGRPGRRRPEDGPGHRRRPTPRPSIPRIGR